ncbi:hypothetical protein M413DRAFT_446844 [Hebeloma cylindrosporum]|uniref:Uncharacterized protein n=1 Tax=Hebeloma cylindrosporum TaxID=76867 RepID=A0A0C2YFT4_HEBCY|nr:hypothetical protein M413DRAFT_446844 [Hebeloma cylindrosporum h7]
MVVAPHPVFFPSPGFQVLSALIHFLGLTVLTHCISRRVQRESLTFHGIKTMPWPRLSVILMFCDSWLFMMSSGILVFGIGLEYSEMSCTAAAYLCILFYSTSKFFVYAFLAEKVHIVWSPTVGVRRFESPVYLTCLVSVSLYCIVMTLMLGGPIHENRENGACVIGLKPLASIPLLVYDLYINLFLTFMFLCSRSAAVIALSTSTVNIVVLIVLQGRELGWVNLGACGADIMVNAAAIFWVSGGKSNREDISSGVAPEPRRRQEPTFSTDASPHYSTKPKSTLPNYPDSPSHVSHFTPSSSFPKYVDTDLERAANGDLLTQPSWIRRLFSKEKPKKERHLKISVTREYDLQTSQIELQRRTDTNSENDHEMGAPRAP